MGIINGFLSALAIGFLTCSCHSRPRVRNLDLPSVMLWAWERPENLAFVDPESTGIAFLAGTAKIASNGSVLFRLRTQKLTLPANVVVLPVVRIESPAAHAAVQPAPLVSEFERIANLPGVTAIQIDFDARTSERAFYRELIASVEVHTAKPISVTALASWCDGDRWLDLEPVTEAVPMFFRMGRGEPRDRNVKSPLCRASVGLSTDEPWPAKRPVGITRIYLFSPRPWTREEYTRAMQRIEDWR